VTRVRAFLTHRPPLRRKSSSSVRLYRFTEDVVDRELTRHFTAATTSADNTASYQEVVSYQA
jgi:hypothetical protein